MKRKHPSLMGMVMVVLGGAGLVAAGARLTSAEDGAKAKPEGVEAKAAFARLKSLAGTWTVDFGDIDAAKSKEHQENHAAVPATETFRLTGAGSSLVETQFPGQKHEMVSVYHLDGEDLRMTHYCAIGNQPRLKLDRARSRPDHLIFVFDGGSNLDPKKDPHIHGLEITFRDKDHVTAAWESFTAGKSSGAHEFNMTRQ